MSGEGWRWRVGVVVRDWACAARLMGRALVDRTPPDALASGSGTPVVVLPGIWEPWRFNLPLARRLHALGHPVHFVPGLGWNGHPLEASADVVSRALAEVGRPVVLVAHSKGGLVGKMLLGLLHTSGPGPAATVPGMVALGSPFGGSMLSVRLLRRTPLGMFAPTGPVIRDLGARTATNHLVVSAGGPWDEMVPDGVHLTGATNVVLPVAGHFLPLVDKDVALLVHGWVDDIAAGRPPVVPGGGRG